ncbi:MAG: hypothetical protein AAFZ65_10130 [Planctomycetota bacterium]
MSFTRACLCLTALAPAAFANGEQWTPTFLLPPGGTASLTRAVRDGLQVGNSSFGGDFVPGYWTDGDAASWTALGSFPNGASVEDVWGTAMAGTVFDIDAFEEESSRATLWDITLGTAQVDLHPPGALSSRASSIVGAQVGGVVDFGTGNRAVLWTATATNFVELHPAGANDSYVEGVTEGQQVGYATFPFSHAGYWSGTPGSWVDLHPVSLGLPSLLASQGFGTDGQQQVGWFVLNEGNLIDHPALWSGSEDSVVDLLPAGWRDGKAFDVIDGRQVGYARPSLGEDYRALVWNGSADDFVDLAATLPPNTYDNVFAYDIWRDDDFWYVIGAAVLPGAGLDPILWTAPIEGAKETVRAGTPPNPTAFFPGVTSGPVVGSTWDPVVDHAGFVSNAVLDLMLVSTTVANTPLPPAGTLLCAPPYLLVPTTAPGTPFAVAIPDNPALVGLPLCTQAISVDPLGAASGANALDLILGAH